MIKVLNQILKFIGILVKVITWIIANGIPFVRGIIEEIKALKEKRAAKKASK